MPISNLARYERIAPFYDLLDAPFERRRYRALWPLLFQGLTGRLLGAGIGTGRNFPCYPHGATVVGIELSPAMLACAELRRNQAAASVELRQMDVTALDFPDAALMQPSRPSCFACCLMNLRCRRYASSDES